MIKTNCVLTSNQSIIWRLTALFHKQLLGCCHKTQHISWIYDVVERRAEEAFLPNAQYFHARLLNFDDIYNDQRIH